MTARTITLTRFLTAVFETITFLSPPDLRILQSLADAVFRFHSVRRQWADAGPADALKIRHIGNRADHIDLLAVADPPVARDDHLIAGFQAFGHLHHPAFLDAG